MLGMPASLRKRKLNMMRMLILPLCMLQKDVSLIGGIVYFIGKDRDPFTAHKSS